MPGLQSRSDECAIIVKAQPHRSSNYFETVCCAGVGRDGSWRRQYPVPFRILNNPQQFKRWDWIAYDFTTSDSDRRRESQKVVPESIKVTGSMRSVERAPLLNPIMRACFADAEGRGESLAMIRPRTISIEWSRKSDAELAEERQKHAELANQMSMFDRTAKPLDPCPYEFVTRWNDEDGGIHRHVCDDWETSAAFFNFRNRYGEEQALQTIKTKYEDQYFSAGLALAFSTHSRRNRQWLLVGMIRLDENAQGDLFLGTFDAQAANGKLAPSS